jgi:hypothetical protein
MAESLRACTMKDVMIMPMCSMMNEVFGDQKGSTATSKRERTWFVEQLRV